MSGHIRSFALINVNNKSVPKTGRYMSATPSGAAKKAFNELLKSKKTKSKSKSKSKSKCKKSRISMRIVLLETTEGSKKKEYSYKVKRITLKEPRVITLKNGTTIEYCYDTKVEKF